MRRTYQLARKHDRPVVRRFAAMPGPVSAVSSGDHAVRMAQQGAGNAAVVEAARAAGAAGAQHADILPSPSALYEATRLALQRKPEICEPGRPGPASAYDSIIALAQRPGAGQGAESGAPAADESSVVQTKCSACEAEEAEEAGEATIALTVGGLGEQAKCPTCEATNNVQKKAAARRATASGAIRQSTVNSPAIQRMSAELPSDGGGKAMPEDVQAKMEGSFGVDFSGVRVYEGPRSETLGARAYTQGTDVHFAPGQYRPGSPSGQELLGHELAHVVQQRQGRVAVTTQAKGVAINDDTALEKEADELGARAARGEAVPLPDALNATSASSGFAQASGQPIVQRRKCTSKDDANKIITRHQVSPTTIQAPGDTVTITVDFACDIRDGESHIETSKGTSLGLKKFLTKSTNQYKRTWDGKKLYTAIGTYLVDDGDYRHRLDNVTYAYKYNPTTKVSDQVYVTGANLISPTIKIAARPYAGTGKEHHHYSAQNVTDLAAIIVSEMSIGNAAERQAIAWAVRNQMIRLGTSSVAAARDHFRDAHGTAGTGAAKATAKTILKKPMADDTTSGAIKWFSPRSMPAKGDSCDKDDDCRGGLITVTNDAGVKVEHYAPSWHLTMTYKAVPGTREWYVRFYAL
ncbi:MAG: DUF4157 domain-containing protein [Proteobacteria bacterium]|nr:DUF4157 domain-containing protein [Pseudomonadota bacterium]